MSRPGWCPSRRSCRWSPGDTAAVKPEGHEDEVGDRENVLPCQVLTKGGQEVAERVVGQRLHAGELVDRPAQQNVGRVDAGDGPVGGDGGDLVVAESHVAADRRVDLPLVGCVERLGGAHHAHLPVLGVDALGAEDRVDRIDHAREVRSRAGEHLDHVQRRVGLIGATEVGLGDPLDDVIIGQRHGHRRRVGSRDVHRRLSSFTCLCAGSPAAVRLMSGWSSPPPQDSSKLTYCESTDTKNEASVHCQRPNEASAGCVYAI